MALDIDGILATLGTEEHKRPPVEQWQPPHSGTIDIVIDEQMQWFHEGVRFERESLVRLLSSILRKDGENYFLVTPAEKLAIDVADVPFKIIAMLEQDGVLYLISNVQDRVVLDEQANWQLRPYQNGVVPYVEVRHNLFARIDRNVYYAMVEKAQQIEKNGQPVLALHSADRWFVLGELDV